MPFSSIIGHENQREALRRAVSENRVSHAYLFSGPEGIGKKLAAFEFAKILNCLSGCAVTKKGAKGERCDCNSCRKIEKAIHPDVFIVEHKGVMNIKVDQIREEIEERLYLTRYEGLFKVAIVDEAERLNQSAQNAFLKTLEEPPADSVIILITSHPQALLPTIRSRCHAIEFKPVSEKLVFEEVRKRTGLSEEEAVIAGRLSGGSLGKALGFDKELLSERKEIILRLSQINPKHASQVLGFTDTILTGSSSEDMENLDFTFEVISFWLRDLLLIKIGFDEESLYNGDLFSLSRGLAEKWSADSILDKMKFVESVHSAVFRANANKQMAIENLVLKIAE